MKHLLAIIALLGLCFAVEADCRRVIRVQHAAVIVEPVIAAVFQPIAVAVPSYSVGLSQQTDSALLERLDRIAAALERGGGQRLEQQAAIHPGQAFLQKSCVACHDASVAKAKGGGNAFFNGGQLVALSDKQKLEMTMAVYQQRMPRGGKATDEDVAALVSFFDSKAAAVAPMPAAK